MPSRILIIEDHDLLRESLTSFFELTADLQVSGVVTSGQEAFDWLTGAEADLVLVDISLPGMTGIEFVRMAREQWPDLRCLMHSGLSSRASCIQSMEAGARGYVTKGDPDKLLLAIRNILSGQTYLDPAVATTV